MFICDEHQMKKLGRIDFRVAGESVMTLVAQSYLLCEDVQVKNRVRMNMHAEILPVDVIPPAFARVVQIFSGFWARSSSGGGSRNTAREHGGWLVPGRS